MSDYAAQIHNVVRALLPYGSLIYYSLTSAYYKHANFHVNYIHRKSAAHLETWTSFRFTKIKCILRGENTSVGSFVGQIMT